MGYRDRPNSIVAMALDDATECNLTIVQNLQEKAIMTKEIFQLLPSALFYKKTVIEIEKLLLESPICNIKAQLDLYPKLFQKIMDYRKILQ